MRKLALSLLSLAASAALSLPATADSLLFTLNNPTQTAAPGASLAINATATAPLTNLGRIYLNSDEFSASFATASDDPFFNNFPFFLAPGASFTGDILDLTLPSNIAAGLYSGSFTVLGGSDGAASDTLAVVPFQVVVSNALSAVPEPGSWLLLATGVAGAFAFGIVRR